MESFIDALLLESSVVNIRSSQLSALCGYQPVSNGWATDKIWENNLAKTHQPGESHQQIRLPPILGRSHMKPSTRAEKKISATVKVSRSQLDFVYLSFYQFMSAFVLFLSSIFLSSALSSAEVWESEVTSGL